MFSRDLYGLGGFGSILRQVCDMRKCLSFLRYYLSVYRRYISNNVARALSFRINFILLFFVDLAFYGSSFGSVSFIFDHVDTVGPWSRQEFLFFVAFMMAVDQIHMSLFMMSFWELSSDLREGRLDFSLLKPTGILFPVFFRHMRIGSMIAFPVPWVVMWYFGSEIGLGFVDWLCLPLFVVLAVALILVVEILLSAAMFWTFEGVGINFIRMQLQSISRWPDFIYGYLFQKTFTFVIPVLLVGSAPVHYLLGSSSYMILVAMLMAILVVSLLVNIVWKIALRRYESASS